MFSTIFFDEIELLCVLFSVLINDLMLALRFLCVQHILFYHKICKQAYCIFLIFILPAKNGISLCKLGKVSGYSTSTSRIYPLLLSSS